MNDRDEQLGHCIRNGDPAGVRALLRDDPGLANRKIRWHLNQDNESDPLHYVSDCVGHDWLTNGTEGEITTLLIESGAAINGSTGNESPLIAAASMGVDCVAERLIEAGADLEVAALFGARALHWASWVGAAPIVAALLAHGARFEERCSEFGATPLFWAVHGLSPKGPRRKRAQVDAARQLIEAGATVATANREELTAIELASQCADTAMHDLLAASA